MHFTFLDRITALEPSKMAQAIKCVSLADDVFAHCGSGPLSLPNFVLMESMAQLAGILVEETLISRGQLGLLALLIMMDKVRFCHPVIPGDRLQLETLVGSIDTLKANMTATAHVAGKLVAQLEIAFVLGSDHPPQLYHLRRQLVRRLQRDADS